MTRDIVRSRYGDLKAATSRFSACWYPYRRARRTSWLEVMPTGDDRQVAPTFADDVAQASGRAGAPPGCQARTSAPTTTGTRSPPGQNGAPSNLAEQKPPSSRASVIFPRYLTVAPQNRTLRIFGTTFRLDVARSGNTQATTKGRRTTTRRTAAPRKTLAGTARLPIELRRPPASNSQIDIGA